MPGAAASLMMLEEAPKETILEVEDEQREVRSESIETDEDESTGNAATPEAGSEQ